MNSSATAGTTLAKSSSVIALARSTAIFNAVLTAMSQAMANGSSQPIELNQKIELDGDVIYNNQQKVSARRGINFGLGAFQR